MVTEKASFFAATKGLPFEADLCGLDGPNGEDNFAALAAATRAALGDEGLGLFKCAFDFFSRALRGDGFARFFADT